MGSKAQAKANSEYAKFMKKMGIQRRTARCPINHNHLYPLGIHGLLTHLMNCK